MLKGRRTTYINTFPHDTQISELLNITGAIVFDSETDKFYTLPYSYGQYGVYIAADKTNIIIGSDGNGTPGNFTVIILYTKS